MSSKRAFRVSGTPGIGVFISGTILVTSPGPLPGICGGGGGGGGGGGAGGAAAPPT